MTTLSASAICGGYATADFIVKGVDITIAPKDLAVIIGPNGAGKSTFLKLLAGLLPKRTGDVSIDGTALPAGDAHAACERGVSFVPQERNVFGSLSVQENLEMGGYLLRSGLKSRIEEQLNRFPMLRGRLREKAGNLSGGQRQVLAVAVALMTNPSVLLLDEPTAGLSPAAAKEIFVLIRDLAASGLAILMVEQNALLALEYGTRGVVLVAGKKVRDDAAASMIEDDEIRHLFLGRAAPAAPHRH
ncbi:branched-chain amino acid ABC transporter ATPase [Bradyrhizobium sp. LTSP849]|uniref:ABC transporter ATP-binding protein n=1 Tax=unclassified Bradyrhizobium TaxID=2631580 RepID=UPI0005D239E0|nr:MULTISPECIES: ABC transporter ATP-binding protein [unclassified Bradyrhizobium]KJC33945.1 branched-chain amino acid ABC transporter ATPase [Bradyrhizobium sp. LTSP849]KJC40912.1 branched-chain amino acid ABC transporter ATPase [Bradyrhizobium sp. LTSP857]